MYQVLKIMISHAGASMSSKPNVGLLDEMFDCPVRCLISLSACRSIQYAFIDAQHLWNSALLV